MAGKEIKGNRCVTSCLDKTKTRYECWRCGVLRCNHHCGVKFDRDGKPQPPNATHVFLGWTICSKCLADMDDNFKETGKGWTIEEAMQFAKIRENVAKNEGSAS